MLTEKNCLGERYTKTGALFNDNLDYTDLENWGFMAALNGEEMQHAGFEGLKERGYVYYERKKV